MSLPQTVAEVLRDHVTLIPPEMAIRLSETFGGSPESWLTQQMQYDLWHAQYDREPVEVRRFVSA